MREHIAAVSELSLRDCGNNSGNCVNGHPDECGNNSANCGNWLALIVGTMPSEEFGPLRGSLARLKGGGCWPG